MAHRKRRWKRVVAVGLFLIGVSLVSYPFVGSFLSRLTQSQVIDGYLSDVASETTLEMETQIQEARDYNEQLLNSSAIMTDPFSMEAFEDALSGYNEILAINDTGVFGYLDIPCVNVHLPIYHGTGSYALQHGVGHLETTSFPVGGESTHAVLSAHSGLTNADMFDRLPDMQVGDTFSISILSQTIYYQVYSIETVLPEQTESLYIQKGADLVTLVTCTPYGINTHRLLVHGQRIENPDQESDDQLSEQTVESSRPSVNFMAKDMLIVALIPLLVIVLLIILLVIALRAGRKKGNGKSKSKEELDYKK